MKRVLFTVVLLSISLLLNGIYASEPQRLRYLQGVWLTERIEDNTKQILIYYYIPTAFSQYGEYYRCNGVYLNAIKVGNSALGVGVGSFQAFDGPDGEGNSTVAISHYERQSFSYHIQDDVLAGDAGSGQETAIPYSKLTSSELVTYCFPNPLKKICTDKAAAQRFLRPFLGEKLFKAIFWSKNQ